MLAKEVMATRCSPTLVMRSVWSAFCAAVVGWSVPVSAQTPLPVVELPVQWITVDDGLPQGTVEGGFQDRAGYLWIPTPAGLVRSDGYSMRVFRHQANDSTSLSSTDAGGLFQSHDGAIWMATETGIDRFDPRTERFEQVYRAGPSEKPSDGNWWHFMQDADTSKLLVQGLRRCLVIDRTPRPGNSTAPARWRVRDHDKVYPGLDLHKPMWVRMTSHGNIWSVNTDSLFFIPSASTAPVGVRSWALPREEPRDGSWEEIPNICIDNDRTRAYFLRGRSIIVFDAITGDPLDTLDTGPDRVMTFRMFGDSRQQFWMALSDTWLSRFDLTDGRLEEVRVRATNRTDMPAQPMLYGCGEDRNGNLYIGTKGQGVMKYDLRQERFQRMLQGQSGWITRGDSKGTLLFDAELRTQLNAGMNEPAVVHVNRQVIAQGRNIFFRGLAVDATGRYWLNTHVSKDGSGARVERWTKDLSEPWILPLEPSEMPREIFHGSSDELWIVVWSPAWTAHQLIRVDTRTSTIIGRYPFPHPIAEGAYPAISAITVAPDSSLWMATVEGLLNLDPRTNTWREFHHDDKDPTSLPGELLYSVCMDPDEPQRYVWVGTRGQGLAKLDIATGKCRRYTTKDGLPDDVIYGILPDTRRNLWISTNQGLCRLDPRTGATRTFTKADGLAGNEFNRYGAEKSPDGRFYFAGVDGYTAFDPEDLYTDEKPSPTVITGLRLANKEVATGRFLLPGEEAPLLPEAIEYLRELTLPHDQRMITFTFACMDHTAPERNRFRYKLENFDEEWVELGTAHEATFTNLDPGRYVFRVQGRNSEEVWDEQGASIVLVITPPWWGTWWFRIAAVLAFAGSLYAFYRYRLAQAVKVVQVRERIARDLHDEIGSTLSSVQLYSAVAQRKTEGKHAEAHELLGRITESTTQVLEAMNDIVWAVNAENDDLAHLVQRMNSYAERLAEARECALRFEVQEGIAAQHLGMTQRKNLYLIFKEALNNAVKYSACRTVLIELRKEGPGFLLRVQDDGIGFDPGSLPTDTMGGNGLGNMRRRAAEMRGTLQVRSAPGQGTTVELRFSTTPGEISVDPMTSPADAQR